MESSILDSQVIETEIVLQERVVTTEFRVVEIHESIQNRFVRVEIEMGPFISEIRPNGEVETHGSGHRGITVWENEEYDSIREKAWSNADMLAIIKTKF